MRRALFSFILFFTFHFSFFLCSAQRQAIDSLQKVLKNKEDDTGKVNLLNALSYNYSRISKYDSSAGYARQALTLANNLGFEEGTADAFYYLGECYYWQENYFQALTNLEQGLSIYLKRGNKAGSGKCFNGIGEVYTDIGDYSKALEFYYKALDLSDEVGENTTARILYNMGTIFSYQHNYPKALEYLFKSLETNRKKGIQLGEANVLSMVGVIFSNQGKYDTAKVYLFKALTLSRKHGDKELEAYIMGNLGDLYLNMENYTEALDYEFRSLALSKQIKYNLQYASSLNSIGQIYTKQKKYVISEKYLDSALMVAKQTGAMEIIKNVWGNKTILDSAAGNYRAALQDNKNYYLFRDSLNLEKTGQEEMNHEFILKTDSVRALQDKKDAVKENEIMNEKRIRNYTLVGLAVVIFFLIFVFIQRNRIAEEKKRGDELRVQVEELLEKRTKEKIHSDANLRTIFDNTDVSFILLDKELKIVSFNNNASAYIKDTVSKELKGAERMETYLLDYSKPRLLEMYHNVLNGKILQTEENYKRMDGTAVWSFNRLAPVSDNNNAIIGMIISMTDITSSKLAEIEREKMTLDLVQRNKDLEQFAFMVSHNLRAPVANIIALANEIGNNELPEEERKEMLTGLAVTVEKLDGVVMDLNQILHIKRQINEQKEKVLFSGLVEDIKIQIGEHVDMSHVKIVTDFSALGEMVAIKSYMYSIFYNLISNSIKFHKPGEKPVIEIKSDRTPDKIILTFKDNGMGINLEENKNKVFELYRRFHTHVEGKGVGLFMCKVQVEALGGTINMKSQINRGTVFTIELPG